jgi:anti-anti-sigma factor
MKIVIGELNNASLIAISGRIDSETSPEVAAAFKTVQDQGQYNIVVDMADLEYMSSATLRALLAAQRASKRTGRGEVVLLRVPEKIRTTLDLAGLLDLFKVYDDTASLPEFPAVEQSGDLSKGTLPA